MEPIIYDIKKGNLKRVARSDFNARNSQPYEESLEKPILAELQDETNT